MQLSADEDMYNTAPGCIDGSVLWSKEARCSRTRRIIWGVSLLIGLFDY